MITTTGHLWAILGGITTTFYTILKNLKTIETPIWPKRLTTLQEDI